MRESRLSYMESFHCVGGSCPDTCCRDWEVVLDAETAAFYRAVPGPLGEEIRAAMQEVDGETCFFLRDGLCPMLNDQGLCRIQLELGEEHLSRSCDLHPRFAEEYGARREWCLSLACPEAVRLLLADSAPLTITETVTDEALTTYNDLDPRLFFALTAARKTAFSLAQDRQVPWQARLARLLAFGVSLQKALDGHRLGRLDTVTARYAAGRFPPLRPGTDPDAAVRALAVLGQLEPINDRWPRLLTDALSAPVSADDRRRFARDMAPWDYAWERLLFYFLYRYFLKAVTDRRLLPRVQLAAFSVLAIRQMALARFSAGGCGEADLIDLIHRFSREVEHSEENLSALLSRLETDPALSPAALTAAAW